ncbi:hypothetical protein IHV10_20350 [Fictibacillus sp. 5RED26]|uniref:thioester domain-containing protein n=1 Tax=Fictibacillus sp. 5RED26 TaxID=2745876 RepID=UPI0018CD7039|nr:thioester domain-containing protein [Fictibacillus sp. 5RED26]MBH0158739.1 hypothetical protein [Fictibacillus sp. 5RED26]
MKNKIQKMLALILPCILFFQAFVLSFEAPVHAETKVEYLGKATYGLYTVGVFKVNGEPAFCIDHDKSTPGTGASYKPGNLYENEKVKAILYYGAYGPENIVGNGTAGIVATTIALDSVVNDNHSSGRNSIPGYSDLMAHAANEDAPVSDISFSKDNVSSSVSGNKQVSESVVFKADPKNSIDIPVPSGVTMHIAGDTHTNKTVKVNGGQSFYFSAALNFDDTITFNNLKPSLGKYQPILFLPNGTTQRLSAGLTTDPSPLEKLTVHFEARQAKINVLHRDAYNNTLLDSDSYSKNIGSKYSYSPRAQISYQGNDYVPTSTAGRSGTVTEDITITFFYDLQRNITVLHKDARDGSLLARTDEEKSRGDEYSYSPRTDLRKGKYTYRPLSTATKSGVVQDRNLIITFLYDVPLIETGLKKIQIYTAPAADKLPVKLELNKTDNYDDLVPDMETARVNVNLYKGTTLIQSNPYTAKSLPTKIDMEIPSKYLTVNTKAPYTVKLEGYNPNDIDIASDARTLTTDGYTSSEKRLRAYAEDQSSLGYTGVVMTEREVRENMVLYFENLSLTFKKIEKKRTGYGFNTPIQVNYSNDLGGTINTSYNMQLPKQLVDTYVNYPVTNDQSIVTLDKVLTDTSTTGQKRTTNNMFELPHVNVERETGNLFTDQQVAAKDKRIKKALRDGGRKFYTPIWGDLGTYPIMFESTIPIGVNKVHTEINDNLEIFAFMYGHMDSPTTKQDGIFLSPVNPSDPLFPDSWTDQDIKEFNLWNKKVN